MRNVETNTLLYIENWKKSKNNNNKLGRRGSKKIHIDWCAYVIITIIDVLLYKKHKSHNSWIFSDLLLLNHFPPHSLTHTHCLCLFLSLFLCVFTHSLMHLIQKKIEQNTLMPLQNTLPSSFSSSAKWFRVMLRVSETAQHL